VKKHIATSNNFGEITIREFDDFDKQICLLKEPQEWCEVMRYSPCGKYLAVGCHDDTLWIYEIDEEGAYKLYSKFTSNSTAITSLDWSMDSELI
jgi:WD40 repeat protein